MRVFGLDGAYVRGWGELRPVLVAVDLGEGKPVAIAYVDEANPQAVKRWLEPLVKRLGVSVIVTDDLASYKVVARKLDLEHQICQFHVRRWVGRALHDLQASVPQEWLWVLEEIKALLELSCRRKVDGVCSSCGSKSRNAVSVRQECVQPWSNCVIY